MAGGFDIGLDKPFFLIAGPCVVESRELAMNTAGELKTICGELGIPFIFKASYDKANRSSAKSFRGLGMDKGLEILADVRKVQLDEALRQRASAQPLSPTDSP